ncbi:hypothetical protein MNEG_8220 [Monoraphidium neglectum]|uniref:Uncharacterized protein n=1 Tax=Monoraphidium neglectum TaxID=145388 RepID=A0A0D2MG96_9CHLO|nr:hypothetical protein MNEG_8220 [Monoraphidium neglectum]KIY99741.1 hypothetical protein MNEG_8220 [Monoraphidium neglectum]|eukprot:XP_013898761.1 hypothetical protein MNEG_8220 [Monoraphidium neglectum]
MADPDNSASHGTVRLRGWCFCANHGLEYCHRCCMDFRMCNNVRLQDELTEEQLERLTEQAIGVPDDARPPLHVQGAYELLRDGTAVCFAHSAVGCERCFDFERQVMDG